MERETEHDLLKNESMGPTGVPPTMNLVFEACTLITWQKHRNRTRHRAAVILCMRGRAQKGLRGRAGPLCSVCSLACGFWLCKL